MNPSRPLALAATLALALVLLPRTALAQAALGEAKEARDGGARDEATALAEAVQREYAGLRTEDCAAACKALTSMRRATERLCALDPGPACSDARAKVDDATARVRAACPECTTVSFEATAAAPVAESKGTRGGCASCATVTSAAGAHSGTPLALAVGLVAARVLRRRRRLSASRRGPHA